MMYYTYILHSTKQNRYYIGYTNDIERRINEHNKKRVGYTKIADDWILVYKSEHEEKRSAMQEERKI
ncbi:MAG: GIY-YIG nuclease family protein [Saprospiraceae bacterium]|nr:GIY-YIG nuclease family protein [Saprospiraceae bacterium]